MSKTLPGAITTMIAGETLTLSTGLEIELTEHQPLITAITQANPAAVTVDVPHNYTTGDTVIFRDIDGMVEIEAEVGVVTVTGATTFTVDIDSTLYTAFVAGLGECHRLMGYTDYDLVLNNGKVVLEPSIAYSPTTMANSSDLAVDNAELRGIIDDDGIDDQDLLAGVYDYARLHFFLIDNQNTGNIVTLKRGRLGEVSQERDLFRAEFRGLAAMLTQDTIETYMPSCRAQLGDAQCGFNIASLEISGTVTAVTSRRKFEDTSLTDADAYFDYGILRWITGNNAGYEMEVREYLLTDPTNPTITFLDKMPADIQIGDTYNLRPGCDKSLTTCRDKFNNVVNMRGFPHLPGQSELLSYGNRTSE
jgi:uncharacterized phage protein (TIGR02218 family)